MLPFLKNSKKYSLDIFRASSKWYSSKINLKVFYFSPIFIK